MDDQAGVASPSAESRAGACWITIGVSGNRSCPELKEHVHCRNCRVYSNLALELLDRRPPIEYIAEWTRHVAKRQEGHQLEGESVTIFRIGAEWLALPTAVVNEVADLRPVHSLPHRSGGVVLGVANIRGELLTCVSLGQLLRSQPEAEDTNGAASTAARRRSLVIQREAFRVVCPVDEIHGIHRIPPGGMQEVPATVAKSSSGGHSRAVIAWRGRSVGLLDDQALFQSLQRSVQ
jgi:chemotaxis-related protein WspD